MRQFSEEELEEISELLSEELFKDGSGRRINRLVAEYGPLGEGSGWAQFGAKDLIKRILRGDGRQY